MLLCHKLGTYSCWLFILKFRLFELFVICVDMCIWIMDRHACLISCLDLLVQWIFSMFVWEYNTVYIDGRKFGRYKTVYFRCGMYYTCTELAYFFTYSEVILSEIFEDIFESFTEKICLLQAAVHMVCLCFLVYMSSVLSVIHVLWSILYVVLKQTKIIL